MTFETASLHAPAPAGGTPPIRDERPRPAAAAPAPASELQAGGLAPGRAKLAAGAALLGCDALGFAAAGGVVAAAPGVGTGPLLALATMAALAGHAAQGLYPGYRILGHERLRRRVRTTLKVGALGGLGAAVLLGGAAPALLVAAYLALALVAQAGLHWATCRALRRAGWWGEPAAILASRNRAPVLHHHFALHWQLGIRPLPPGTTCAPLVLLATKAVPLEEELDRLRARFDEVVLLADTPHLEISGLQPADLRGEIGLRLAGAAPGRSNGLGGRALDCAVALAFAVVAVPLVLAAAGAVFLVDPGPVFYRQPREGLGGRTVRVLKLRTMFRDAEARLEEVLRRDPRARAEWAAHFKLRDDPRILPVVGRFLRSSSLDELPQLWNVLVGEMRIVGPRPFPAYHIEAMSPEFRAKRCSVVPGLTGLWQISERSDADLEVQHQLDDFYIDNRSFWLDCSILLGTVSAVLARRGA